MEHRHDHGGLVPFTAAISTDAAGILSSLSHALGSGNDLSPVIEKLALSILPEWRQLQFEKHAHQKQIDDLQGKIAALEQDLTAATVAALATPTNATRMSDELFSTGAPEAATQPDGGLSSLATYQGKRFLKSIHELDPSARRKRRAKFVKCLTELCKYRFHPASFRPSAYCPRLIVHGRAMPGANLTLPSLAHALLPAHQCLQRTRMGLTCLICLPS